MTTLNDQQNTGLPEPPAPPRRGANPWPLSDTARKPEAMQPSVSPPLLEELMKRVRPEQAATQEAPQLKPAAKRARPGLIGLVVLLIAISIVVRLFLDERVNGNWARYIGPLVFIAIIAHGLWRSRQRREENRTSQD